MSAITVNDIEEAAKRFADPYREYKPPYFFTSGTGIPDNVAIEYYKRSDVIVVTRNGEEYQYGERMADNGTD